MSNARYEVYVGVEDFRDGQFALGSVEILPPIPESLATKVGAVATQFMNEQARGRHRDYQHPNAKRFDMDGFCDQGATVSTLIRFFNSPTFDGGPDEMLDKSTQLQTLVERALSPSGRAIATKTPTNND